MSADKQPSGNSIIDQPATVAACNADRATQTPAAAGDARNQLASAHAAQPVRR